jgi:hypothetical protein
MRPWLVGRAVEALDHRVHEIGDDVLRMVKFDLARKLV